MLKKRKHWLKRTKKTRKKPRPKLSWNPMPQLLRQRRQKKQMRRPNKMQLTRLKLMPLERQRKKINQKWKSPPLIQNPQRRIHRKIKRRQMQMQMPQR